MQDSDRGMIGLLNNAGKKDKGFNYLFSGGDLCQMGNQCDFLRDHGMSIGKVDVYPAVKTEEEYIQGLRLIWENRVDGWWNYRRELVERGICTEEEFNTILHSK